MVKQMAITRMRKPIAIFLTLSALIVGLPPAASAQLSLRGAQSAMKWHIPRGRAILGQSQGWDNGSRGPAVSFAAPNNQVTLNCSGSVGGYKIQIDQAHSSVSGSSVICNYVATTQDKNPTTSGFAVTVEYYCPGAGAAAWQSKTGTPQPPWDPTNNPNGRIGSQGGNSLLIREDGLVTGFAGDFTVTEKLFLQIDPQTIATVVVHTDVKQPPTPDSGPAPAPDPNVLNLDATKTQGVAVGIAAAHHAMISSLNCNQSSPTDVPTPTGKILTLRPSLSETINGTEIAGTPITVRGIVWAVDDDGWYHLPVQAKIHITQGSTPALDTTTNAVGYFSVEYTPTDPSFQSIPTAIVVRATPLNPQGYQSGQTVIEFVLKPKGSLSVTIATDKAVYAPGEPVTVSGTVMNGDKPISAALEVRSDLLVQNSIIASDGSFSFTFVPGQEKNRSTSPLGPFKNGFHLISVKSGLAGYENDSASATYLVEQPLTCASLPVQVTSASGTPNAQLINPDSEIFNSSLTTTTRVNANTKMVQGTKVATSPGDQVTLRLEGEQGAAATIAIGGSSDVQIQTFCKDKTTGRITAVLVVSGPGQVVINKSDTGSIFSNLDLAIVTPAARVKSLHTRYFVGVVADGTTTIAALQNPVGVSMPDGSNGIELPEGNRIVIHPGQKPDASQITPMDGQVDPGLVQALNAGKPPVHVPQPNVNATVMTLQTEQRYVFSGDTVLVPVWLVQGQSLANLNFEVDYDPAVLQLAGDVLKGDLLDNALFRANPNRPGSLFLALAQTQALQGTGTLAEIPFHVIGKPGDVSSLGLTVTSSDDPNGGVLAIDLNPGQIEIVNDDGTLPQGGIGSTNGSPGGSGSGPNGSGTGPNGSGVGGTTTGGIQKGDCDGDSQLTEVDALCALEMSTGIRTPRLVVDMDGDGSVTSRDAVIILQQAVGK